MKTPRNFAKVKFSDYLAAFPLFEAFFGLESYDVLVYLFAYSRLCRKLLNHQARSCDDPLLELALKIDSSSATIIVEVYTKDTTWSFGEQNVQIDPELHTSL